MSRLGWKMDFSNDFVSANLRELLVKHVWVGAEFLGRDVAPADVVEKR